MKKKLIIIITIILAIIILSSIVIYAALFSWGEEGDLILTISIDKKEFQINDTVLITVSLDNIGDTKMRVLNIDSYFKPIITDKNGTIIWMFTIEEFDRGPLNNADLRILNSGSSISKDYYIDIHPDFFDEGSNYNLYAEYFADLSDDGRIFLPYWKGSLESNVINFTVS
jgi:hypothetical protein